ncbi:MAG: hypothetical protein ACK5KQ_00110 [Anaerorhabdus sp.]
MVKEKLKKTQKVAYQMLSNALVNDHLSHAYLIYGDRNPLKMDLALLLAKSVVCDHSIDGFACETCSTCLRFDHNNYSDLIVIDGKDASIKKEEILDMQMEFSKSAVEGPLKICIINKLENSSIEAMNCLLKFLEESIDCIVIIVSDSIDSILETIISRCQKILIKPMDNTLYYDFAISNGYNEIDCYLLSKIVNSEELITTTINDEFYQVALNSLKIFSECFISDIHKFLVLFDASLSLHKGSEKAVISYFLDLAIVFIKDVISSDFKKDGWYYENVNKCKGVGKSFDKVLLILLSNKDKLNKTYEAHLLMASVVYQIKEVI